MAKRPRKPIERLPFVPSDGGRATAPGFVKAAKRDCVTRAIALATGRPYESVWKDMKPFAVRNNPDRGVYTNTAAFKAYMAGQGFLYRSCLSSKGRAGRVKLRAGDLPTKGRLVVHTRGHAQAVIDGVLHDTHYTSKPVRGYWAKGVAVVRS
jgi:hypothetical protein